MNVATLLSGGKDSLYATYVSIQYGWDVLYGIAIKPKKLSWMFHTENVHLVDYIAKNMGLPLIERESNASKEDELEDLKKALEGLDIDGVVSGAIASEYQRTRIEKICHEIGIKSFTPLWHKDQYCLLKEMIEAGFKIIIVAVAAEGLGKEWLGREINKECLKDLLKIHEKYGINISGEGGEYETFVIDCPLYKKKLFIEEAEEEWDGKRGTLNIKKIVRENKQCHTNLFAR